MSRHSLPNMLKHVRTEKDEGGKKTTTYSVKNDKQEEESKLKKRQYDEDESTIRSFSSRGHTSGQTRHGSDRHGSEDVSVTRVKRERHYEDIREVPRHDKKPKYPDQDGRFLSHLHYTNRVEERLMNGGGRGNKGKNHRNVARSCLNEFEDKFYGKGRHDR